MIKYPNSQIAQILSKGKPLQNYEIIDCHAHLGQWFNFNTPRYDGKSLVDVMDILGIDKMCISALLSIGPDFVAGNEWVSQVVKRYPGRFFGYIGVDPHYPKINFKEIHRHWEKNMNAIKTHPETHDYAPDGREYRRVYEFLQEKKGLVLSHVWGVDAVKTFGKLAGEYDDVIFILGHSGGKPKAIYEAIEVANKYKNIYLDLTGSYHYEGIVELMTNEVGADRVLFGTDAPFLDARPAVGRVGYADISDEEKMKIMGKNMKNILESLSL